MKHIAQEIDNMLERYRDCWSRLDFEGLRDLLYFKRLYERFGESPPPPP